MPMKQQSVAVVVSHAQVIGNDRIELAQALYHPGVARYPSTEGN